MNNNKLLSICIPTFNRKDELKICLDRLLENNFDVNEVEIIIVDNNSNYDIYEELKEYQDKNSLIKVFKNSVNIGGNANIVRCLEYATGDWIWFLGDDDKPYDYSISLIIKSLKNITPNIKLIKFSSSLGKVNEDCIISVFNDLLNLIKDNSFFPNMLFMSTCVVNRKYYLDNIIDVFANLYACAPHILLPITSLSKNSQNCSILFSKNFICEWGDSEITWVPSLVWFSIMKAFNEIPSISSLNKRKISKYWLQMNLRKIITSIRDLYFNRGYSKKECNFYYNKYCYYLYGSVYYLLNPFFQLLKCILYISIRKQNNKKNEY